MNWEGLERYRIDLKLPLLVIRGNHGLLACGYLNIETFDKTGEIAAIVSGVKSFDEMLQAEVKQVSAQAEQIGIKSGMTGAEVIEQIR